MPIIFSIIGLIIIMVIVIALKSTNNKKTKSHTTTDGANKIRFSKKDKDIIDLASQLADLLDKLE